jgi:hypothetical protein
MKEFERPAGGELSSELLSERRRVGHPPADLCRE